jgi:hypothetical protein
VSAEQERLCDLAGETLQESKRLDMARQLVGSLGIAAEGSNEDAAQAAGCVAGPSAGCPDEHGLLS